jgi:integrase
MASKHGLLLDNPARSIARRKGHKKVIQIPTREEFKQLLAAMRANGANDSANLIKLLARSGCRLSEIVGNKKYKKEPMRWRDIDFDRKMYTVTKSKNHEGRTVDLLPKMEECLRELPAESPGPHQPDDRIIPIASARTALENACRKLGLPRYGHHTFRHYLCTTAIAQGVDFETIAYWVGHKDNGALACKTYGHLRKEHSAAMARRMIFDDDEDRPPTNVIPINAAYRRSPS